MCHTYSCPQIRTGINLPVKQQTKVDIRIYFRTNYIVHRIRFLIIFLPSERRSKIPLIVERQTRGYTHYPGSLECINSQRISYFFRIEESIIPHSDSLYGMRVYFPPISVGRKLESILHMSGKGLSDRSLSCIHAFKESVCRKCIGRTKINSYHMNHLSVCTIFFACHRTNRQAQKQTQKYKSASFSTHLILFFQELYKSRTAPYYKVSLQKSAFFL